MKEERLVAISRGPQSTMVSEIDIKYISNIHWGYVSGGYKKKTGYALLYGMIPYEMAMKLVDCSGMHNFGGNDAKICIEERYNKDERYCAGYNELKKKAGEKPGSMISENRPEGQPPCTKKILMLLGEGKMMRFEVRERLLEFGYKPQTIRGAIKSLHEKEMIELEGSSRSRYQAIRIKK